MAVVPESLENIISIVRNVTGRNDSSDPLFTDTIMAQRVNAFIQNEGSLDVRLFENHTWWEFQIDENSNNPYPVDLDALQFTTIQPPAYVDGFILFWYEDPTLFYGIWPETQTYTPSRPTYVLYYNNELVFRNPPDKQYNVKIAAYKINNALAPGQTLPNAYTWRYIAYGTALDIFADFGENDRYDQTYPIFQRYRGLVYNKTYIQLMNQRTTPQF